MQSEKEKKKRADSTIEECQDRLRQAEQEKEYALTHQKELEIPVEKPVLYERCQNCNRKAYQQAKAWYEHQRNGLEKQYMATLKREFEEELHAKIEVDNLLAIGEIYFPWGKRPCHQICLYYNVHLMDDNIPLDGVFHGYDELDNERIDLDFCWVSLEDLKKGTKVYPLELIPYILESGKEIVHFVSKQI